MAPCEALYGRNYRPPVGWFKVSESSLHVLEIIYESLEKVQVIRDRLKIAYSQQKSYAKIKRIDLEFEVGDMVYLKISPHESGDEIW